MTLDRVALVRAQRDVDERLPPQQLVEDGRQVALVVVPPETELLLLMVLLYLLLLLLLLDLLCEFHCIAVVVQGRGLRQRRRSHQGRGRRGARRRQRGASHLGRHPTCLLRLKGFLIILQNKGLGEPLAQFDQPYP